MSVRVRRVPYRDLSPPLSYRRAYSPPPLVPRYPAYAPQSPYLTYYNSAVSVLRRPAIIVTLVVILVIWMLDEVLLRAVLVFVGLAIALVVFDVLRVNWKWPAGAEWAQGWGGNWSRAWVEPAQPVVGSGVRYVERGRYDEREFGPDDGLVYGDEYGIYER